MSELDRRFHLVSKKVAGQKAGECAHEDELVDWECKANRPSSEGYFSCAKCAPLRELAESCWHELPKVNGAEMIGNCINCGHHFIAYHNPTYTIQTIKATLKKLGEWEGFSLWHWEHIEALSHANVEYDLIDLRMGLNLIRQMADEILTTDSLMLEAACAYLEAR